MDALQHFCTEEQRSRSHLHGAASSSAGLRSPATGQLPHHWQCHQNGKDKVSQQTGQSQPDLAVTMRDWDVTGDPGPPCQPHRVPRRSHTVVGTLLVLGPPDRLHAGPVLSVLSARPELGLSSAPEGALWPVFVRLRHKGDPICTRSGQESQQSHG